MLGHLGQRWKLSCWDGLPSELNCGPLIGLKMKSSVSCCFLKTHQSDEATAKREPWDKNTLQDKLSSNKGGLCLGSKVP